MDHPTIIPTIRYKDAARAISWINEAFGFQQHLVVPGENKSIAHAQLVLGNGMIMLGSSRDDPFCQIQTPLKSVDSRVSQSPHIVVEVVDGHYEQAKAAGAIIILEPEEQPHGGKLYSCRDFEGNSWNFGSYDPWETPLNPSQRKVKSSQK